MRIKKFISFSLSIIIALSLMACSKGDNDAKKEDNQKVDKSFEEMLKDANGSTVNFYGYGGNELMNKWVDNIVAKDMKEKYDITVKRVGMDIDEILNKLLSEKQAGKKEGTIDVVWINGENFKTAKDSKLLFGEFVNKLPNFNSYVDTTSDAITTDFGTKVESMEAPFGSAQFTVAVNSDKISENIDSAETLKEVIEKNPGKFTYPALPDFTGSAFVRNIIYDIVGYDVVSKLPADEDKVREAIKPAIDYLNEIKPYLWNQGKTYPSTTAQLDNMYSDEEIYFTMTYNPNSYQGLIEEGTFTKATKLIEFKDGNLSNIHFLSIPFNTINSDGAMVLINYLLSIDAQGSKTFSKNWGDSTVLDMNKVPESEISKFSDQTVTIEKTAPELDAAMVPIIEKIWTEEVLEGEE